MQDDAFSELGSQCIYHNRFIAVAENLSSKHAKIVVRALADLGRAAEVSKLQGA
jgi:hypothetical protein